MPSITKRVFKDGKWVTVNASTGEVATNDAPTTQTPAPVETTQTPNASTQVQQQTGQNRQTNTAANIIGGAGQQKIQKTSDVTGLPVGQKYRFGSYIMDGYQYSYDSTGNLVKGQKDVGSFNKRGEFMGKKGKVVGIEEDGRRFDIGSVSEGRAPIQGNVVVGANQGGTLTREQQMKDLVDAERDTGMARADEATMSQYGVTQNQLSKYLEANPSTDGFPSPQEIQTWVSQNKIPETAGLPGEISGTAKLSKYMNAGLHPAPLPAGYYHTARSESGQPLSISELANRDWVSENDIFAGAPTKGETEDAKDYEIRLGKWKIDQLAPAYSQAMADMTRQQLSEIIRSDDISRRRMPTAEETIAENKMLNKQQAKINKDKVEAQLKKQLADEIEKQTGDIRGSDATVKAIRASIEAELTSKSEQRKSELFAKIDKAEVDANKANKKIIMESMNAALQEQAAVAAMSPEEALQYSNQKRVEDVTEALSAQIDPKTGAPYSPLAAQTLATSLVKNYGEDLDKMQSYMAFNGALASGQINTADHLDLYEAAIDYGKTGEARNFVKLAFGETVAKSARNTWLEDNGLDPEKTTVGEQKIKNQTAFYSGEMDDAQVLGYLETLMDEDDTTKATFAMETALERGTYADNPDMEATIKKTLAQMGVKKDEATGDIMRDADSVMEGVLNTQDISVKDNYRAKVAAELKSRATEARKSGDMLGLMRASATYDKEPSDTFLSSMEKTISVLGQLGVLQQNAAEAKLGPLLGAFREKNPWDTQAQTIKAQLSAIVPNLARGVYGEVGVLTDNDIRTYSKTIPNLTSTEDVRNAVLYITVDMIKRNIETKIKTQDAGQRDMSGFAEIYGDVQKTADDILLTLEGSQPGGTPQVEVAEDPEFEAFAARADEHYGRKLNRDSQFLKDLYEKQKPAPQKSAGLTPELESKISEVATNLNINPEHLTKAIDIETVGTFDPSIKNPKSSATGLIQFMESTAENLGTTTEELAKMSAVEQMDFVSSYLADKGQLNTASDVYMAIFAPSAIGKPDDYVVYGEEAAAVNQAISQGRKQITVADIKNFVENA